MLSKIRTITLTGIFCCIFSGVISAQATDLDPFTGVWKANIARSTFFPGPRPPSDLVLIFEFLPMEDGFTRYTQSNSSTPAGGPGFEMSMFKIDGQQWPSYSAITLEDFLKTGEESSLTRSYRQLDSRSVEITTYNEGTPVTLGVRAVSADGQSFTITNRSTNAQGMETVITWFFERIR